MNRAAKPMLAIGGRTMLERVLDAVAGAEPTIVVGPDSLDVPAGVGRTCEQPAGAGPVAALAAGLARVPPECEHVAVLAADLPFLTADDVQVLRTAVGSADGAAFVDEADRTQWLCGVWRFSVLRHRLTRFGDPAGRALRDFVAGLRVRPVRLADPRRRPAPWYDCDTEDDLRRAQE